MENTYIYFQNYSIFVDNNLPYKLFELSESVSVGVHRLLADENLNYIIHPTENELLQEKQRLEMLGIPEKDFDTYQDLMQDLQKFQESL